MSQHGRQKSSVNVIHFPSTLNAPEMVRMKPHLARLLNRHPKLLLLDLSATRRVELAGLGMLVDRLRRYGNGSEVRFSNVSPQVHRTLIRAGLNGLIGCC